MRYLDQAMSKQTIVRQSCQIRSRQEKTFEWSFPTVTLIRLEWMLMIYLMRCERQAAGREWPRSEKRMKSWLVMQ
jgi:hypothetical protein